MPFLQIGGEGVLPAKLGVHVGASGLLKQDVRGLSFRVVTLAIIGSDACCRLHRSPDPRHALRLLWTSSYARRRASFFCFSVSPARGVCCTGCDGVRPPLAQ